MKNGNFVLFRRYSERREILGWVIKGKRMALHRGTNALLANLAVGHFCEDFEIGSRIHSVKSTFSIFRVFLWNLFA